MNNPRDAAKALAELCPRRIVYDDGEDRLLIYSDELRQWRSSTQALYKLIDSKRFYIGDYATGGDYNVLTARGLYKDSISFLVMAQIILLPTTCPRSTRSAIG
jgi:hypothetical protein